MKTTQNKENHIWTNKDLGMFDYVMCRYPRWFRLWMWIYPTKKIRVDNYLVLYKKIGGVMYYIRAKRIK